MLAGGVAGLDGGAVCRGQAQSGRGMFDQPRTGPAMRGAAQRDMPSRRAWPKVHARHHAPTRHHAHALRCRVTVGEGGPGIAARGGDAPARACGAVMRAFGPLVQDQGGGAVRGRGQLKATGGVEIDIVQFRQHGDRRSCAQRLLECPEALRARAGVDGQQAGRDEAERRKPRRVERGAACGDPDDRPPLGEAGEQDGGKAGCRAILGRTGDLVQAARGDTASQPGVDRGDAER